MRCLIYAPFSFSGRGPAESCVQLAGPIAARGVATEIYVGRLRTPTPPGVAAHAPFASLGSRLPWKVVQAPAQRLLSQHFRRALATADPRATVAWFWPGSPTSIVREARARGIVTVREMINSALATAGPTLDAAYARLGLPPTHGITSAAIASENEALTAYDFVFASNPEVESSLEKVGIARDKILRTTFGWNPDRFSRTDPTPRHTFRAVFVGSAGVRKGVPDLLEAWASAEVEGELLIVGKIDPEIAHLVDRHVGTGRVRLSGYVSNPGALYTSSDLFVFPTLEEGGPQVTYEAAGCGLPVVTTPMGAARLVVDGRTGIIVPPCAPGQLADAITTLARDGTARQAYGAEARRAATAFTYQVVGAQRAELLERTLARRD